MARDAVASLAGRAIAIQKNEWSRDSGRMTVAGKTDFQKRFWQYHEYHQKAEKHARESIRLASEGKVEEAKAEEEKARKWLARAMELEPKS